MYIKSLTAKWYFNFQKLIWSLAFRMVVKNVMFLVKKDIKHFRFYSMSMQNQIKRL